MFEYVVTSLSFIGRVSPHYWQVESYVFVFRNDCPVISNLKLLQNLPSLPRPSLSLGEYILRCFSVMYIYQHQVHRQGFQNHYKIITSHKHSCYHRCHFHLFLYKLPKSCFFFLYFSSLHREHLIGFTVWWMSVNAAVNKTGHAVCYQQQYRHCQAVGVSQSLSYRQEFVSDCSRLC